MAETKTPPDERKVSELVQRKVQLGSQIKDLQEQMKQVNLELLKSGADPHIALCW